MELDEKLRYGFSRELILRGLAEPKMTERFGRYEKVENKVVDKMDAKEKEKIREGSHPEIEYDLEEEAFVRKVKVLMTVKDKSKFLQRSGY